jgi:hypothetical protein
MKIILMLFVIVFGVYFGYTQMPPPPAHAPGAQNTEAAPATAVAPGIKISPNDAAIARAFENRLSNIQVQGQGRVTQVLEDDNDGSRHQRFIIRLDSGQTLLIAHNIDLAPRLDALSPGDTIEFNGEYEWNPKGGVIHWTHHDPEKRHPGGWLKYNGQTFQ